MTEGWNAGYSTCDPRMLYLPLSTEGGTITVEAQENDKNSLLNFTRALIKLRHQLPALGNDGSWLMLSNPASYPMVYQREKDGQRLVIVINPSGKKASTDLAPQGITGKEIIATGKAHYSSGKLKDHVTAQPFSAVVFQ